MQQGTVEMALCAIQQTPASCQWSVTALAMQQVQWLDEM